MTSPMFLESKVYKPFLYPWAVDITVDHERMHWIEEEADLGDDATDWKGGRLTDTEKNFVTQILRMFTQSDVSVGGFYFDILIPKFKNNEIRNMLSSFATREGIHQRAYSLLNETLGLPEGDYAAFREYKEMADKAEFMVDADPSTRKGLALALSKSVFNEGVSLFASFVMLLNFQRRGVMKGMGKIVEWSVRDETKHIEGIAQLFRTYCAEFPHIVNDEFKKSIYDIARTVVELEDRFIDLAYAMGAVEGLTADEVKQYIRYIADRRLVMLGLKPNFDIDKNPLPWVDWILNGADHTNFFEARVTEYEVAGLTGEWDYKGIPEFIVYKKEGCDYCTKALEMLKGRNVQVINASQDQNAYQYIKAQFGTFPQIWRYGVYIGGHDALKRELEHA